MGVLCPVVDGRRVAVLMEEISRSEIISRLQRLETVVWMLLGVNIPQLGMLIA